MAEGVRIVRDTYGVPDIFGDSDEAVCFGLAWAQCEDNAQWVMANPLVGGGNLLACPVSASNPLRPGDV